MEKTLFSINKIVYLDVRNCFFSNIEANLRDTVFFISTSNSIDSLLNFESNTLNISVSNEGGIKFKECKILITFISNKFYNMSA